MPPVRRPVPRRRANGFLRASGDGPRLFPWMVLAVAVVLQVVWVLVMRWTDATMHPLAPAGAVLMFVAVVAAAFAGVFVGLVAALVGGAASLSLLADLSSGAAIGNAAASTAIWCGAAVTTGLVGRHLRTQVYRREQDLELTLDRSLSARDTLERVLDFSPQFFQGETLAEVAKTICHTALDTFDVDNARVYGVEDDLVTLLALAPAGAEISPGFTVAASDFPDLQSMLAGHRPSFVGDLRELNLTGAASDLRRGIGIVSSMRIPIVGPQGPVGVLGLGWDHVVVQPPDETTAIMQRFADQSAIAWQNALRSEAQQRADALHETLERMVALAPTFHITGTSEEVGEIICKAALATFDCTGASLYRVEGDRLRVLGCLPPLGSLPRGRTVPLVGEIPAGHEMGARLRSFIPNVWGDGRSTAPLPPEILRQEGAVSALCVPLRFTPRGPRNLLMLTWDRPRSQPDENLLAIVERFADQSALALSNASMERLHARLEASLLPTAPVDHPSLRILTRYRTGEQRLRLGGDFLGFTADADEVLHFVIGDVSGHGPDAAALGATVRATWKALALAGESIPQTFAVMRKILVAERREPHVFATILAGRIDTRRGTLTCMNAGHQPPLLVTGSVEPLRLSPSAPLGVDRPDGKPIHLFRLPKRWTLFCYTDGLTDARLAPGSPQRYGEERLQERLAAWVGADPDGEMLGALVTEIETQSGSPFADDVAVLVICTRDVGEGPPT